MNPELSRREWIHRGLRYGGIGLLGGVVAVLSTRSRNCTTRGPCLECPLFEGCALPEADAARDHENPASSATHD